MEKGGRGEERAGRSPVSRAAIICGRSQVPTYRPSVLGHLSSSLLLCRSHLRPTKPKSFPRTGSETQEEKTETNAYLFMRRSSSRLEERGVCWSIYVPTFRPRAQVVNSCLWQLVSCTVYMKHLTEERLSLKERKGEGKLGCPYLHVGRNPKTPSKPFLTFVFLLLFLSILLGMVGYYRWMISSFNLPQASHG